MWQVWIPRKGLWERDAGTGSLRRGAQGRHLWATGEAAPLSPHWELRHWRGPSQLDPIEAEGWPLTSHSMESAVLRHRLPRKWGGFGQSSSLHPKALSWEGRSWRTAAANPQGSWGHMHFSLEEAIWAGHHRVHTSLQFKKAFKVNSWSVAVVITASFAQNLSDPFRTGESRKPKDGLSLWTTEGAWGLKHSSCWPAPKPSKSLRGPGCRALHSLYNWLKGRSLKDASVAQMLKNPIPSSKHFLWCLRHNP